MRLLLPFDKDLPFFSHERRPQLPSGMKREDLSLNYAFQVGSRKVNSLKMVGCMLMIYLVKVGTPSIGVRLNNTKFHI